jgi:hypothetical protein
VSAFWVFFKQLEAPLQQNERKPKKSARTRKIERVFRSFVGNQESPLRRAILGPLPSPPHNLLISNKFQLNSPATASLSDETRTNYFATRLGLNVEEAGARFHDAARDLERMGLVNFANNRKKIHWSQPDQRTKEI